MLFVLHAYDVNICRNYSVGGYIFIIGVESSIMSA